MPVTPVGASHTNNFILILQLFDFIFIFTNLFLQYFNFSNIMTDFNLVIQNMYVYISLLAALILCR